MRTAAVILAAGASSRFGRPKQLLEVNGETLVSHACRVAVEASCSPVIVVLGAHAGEVRKRGLPSGVRTVVNERWSEGMGTSLARGVSEAGDPDALLVMLADQPGVETGTIRVMKQRLAGHGVSIVRCRQGGVPGPPVMFAARHFPELMELCGDEGGRAVVRKHPDAVATVDAPGVRWDIDDEAAWRRFLRAGGSSV